MTKFSAEIRMLVISLLKKGHSMHHVSCVTGINRRSIRNCLNNAVMENFFGILKSEVFYLQEFTSYDHFIAEIHSYITYYNTEWI